ncbi:hypothetical protein HDU67_005006 [Dinochytrium kinnereticum]|nr:hypothetical protein HDU67_005006 [Dinochytrium kinnereticum]
MVVLNVRRAEPSDVLAIHNLTRDLDTGDHISRDLRAKFGDYVDVSALIDSSPLSFVAYDQNNVVLVGFCSMSNGPPLNVDLAEIPSAERETRKDTPGASRPTTTSVSTGNWEIWLKGRYECKDIHIYNTKFLSFFVAQREHQTSFVDAAMTAAFNLIPSLRNICYFLPENLNLFPPFSLPRNHVSSPDGNQSEGEKKKGYNPGKPNGYRRRIKHIGGDTRSKFFNEVPIKYIGAPFTLHVCGRRDMAPPLKVRRARVEDCDDLAPMFKKQNLLQEQNADHYLAELLESTSESIKTLVAEADGNVVGFMSLTKDIDQEVISKLFNLDIFDNLVKDIPPDLAEEVEKAKAAGVENPLDDPNLPKIDPIQAALDSMTPQAIAAAKATALLAAQQAAITAARELQLQPNVFCISLLCIDDHYANQAIEFVKAAFALFGDKDYCVVTVPTTVPEIPLLRSFIPVQPRAGKIPSYGIGETISVRKGRARDTENVGDLVKGLAIEAELLRKFKDSIEDGGVGEAKLITPECANQIVGIALLEKCLDPSALSDQFNIEEFLNLKVASLNGPVLQRHLIMNPIFSHHSRLFIEEIFRQASIPCLLFAVDDQSKTDPATRQLAVKELIPVKRRRQIQFKDGLRDGSPVAPTLPFNLQMMCPAMLYEPKIILNTRIVVVGGSDVGLAFLERLVYKSHLYFAHLTLISSAGAPPVSHSSSFASSLCYSPTELKQLGLDHYVQVIKTTTNEFDRVMKRVRLHNGAMVPYDYLFLTPGVQFFSSYFSEELSHLNGVYNISQRDFEMVERVIAKLSRRNNSEATFAVIKTSPALLILLKPITPSPHPPPKQLAMIQKGVPASWIALVLPPHKNSMGCFDNPVVEKNVHEKLASMGVHIFDGYKVVNWESHMHTISSVMIWSKETKSELALKPVDIFLYADEKSVDPETFRSVNDSCLVFDGRLVIDKYFRTQDPYIYAAGSISKYSSKYQTKWSHGHYDSKEVGYKLADTILSLVDPVCPPIDLDESTQILRFTSAKKMYAKLPGGLIYFHFDEPRLPGHSLEYRQKRADYGRDLVIDNDVYGYFRIHVDPHGLHERYLNCLVSRFDEGIITDFVTFFADTWALPIFHDRFQDFVEESRKELLASHSNAVDDVTFSLLDLGTPDAPIEEEERVDIHRRFNMSEDRKKWDDKIFEYVQATQVFKSKGQGKNWRIHRVDDDSLHLNSQAETLAEFVE